MLKLICQVMIRLTAVICLFFTLAGIAAAARSFIIDTDLGIDDVIAIMYMLNQPDVNVEAITIESTGNAHCLPALKNATGLLKLMNRTDIPVDCGREEPLSDTHHFPKSVLTESDTLAGTAKSLPQRSVTTKLHAVDLMIKTIRESQEPINILAIGPLTNVAEVFTKAPDIKNRIENIYIMGGAVNVPGNLADAIEIDNKTAEWNIFLDPLAASIVLKQSVPVTLISLDVTNSAPLDMIFYNLLKKNHKTKSANFVFSMLKHKKEMLQNNQWYFWDPLAAVIACDESIASFDMLPLSVILRPENQSGRTALDAEHGQIIRVVTKVKLPEFKNVLLNGLNTGLI